MRKSKQFIYTVKKIFTKVINNFTEAPIQYK
jgi:hypothetical protein